MLKVGNAYKRLIDSKVFYIVEIKEKGESNIVLSEQRPENFKSYDHYSFTVGKQTLEECYREHVEFRQADLFTS